jgi:hypothetical protein
MDALAAADAFVAERFPVCVVALLAGSVVRGEATPTSDLDIVIVTTIAATPDAPYRESFVAFGWRIEAFVHTAESYPHFFASDTARRRPSLPRMCAEGVVLRDAGGLAQRIKDEARHLLERGPVPLTTAELDAYRYRVTDLLDDLEGSTRLAETIFIANELAVAASELILLHHGQWIGLGKWVHRAMARFDPARAERLSAALLALYRDESVDALGHFAEEALAAVGGRLFAGYSLGKRLPADDS